MKKISAFIFSILISFLSFTSIATAAGDETPKITPQAFGDVLLVKAKEVIDMPTWEGLHENSQYWAEKAAGLAKQLGLEPRICVLSFHNAANHWVITLQQGHQMFICDYYKVLHEFSEKHSLTLTRPWQCMECGEYVHANRIDTGIIFETMFSFQY